MQILAGDSSIPAAALIAPAVDGLRGLIAVAVPLMEESVSDGESGRNPGSSLLADPVVIGLLVGLALFLLSLRLGGGKKRE